MAGRMLGSLDGAPDAIDGREILAVLRRRKWMIVGTSIVVTLLASVAVALLPPRYKAFALLLVDPRESQIVQLHTPVSNLSLTADLGLIKTEVGILGSDEIIRRVVTSMKLFDRPEFHKPPGLVYRMEGVLRNALSDWNLPDWIVAGTDISKQSAREISEELSTEVLEQEAISDAIGVYRRDLSVSNSEGSSLISLSFEATDPELAAAIVREHLKVYLEQKKDAQDAAIQQAAAWLKEQRSVLEAKLGDLKRAAQQFRQQNNIVSTGTTTTVIQRLNELNTQLLKAQGELAELEARVAQVRKAAAAPGGIFSIPEVLASHLVEHYRTQEADVLQRQAELLQEYGARHPKVVEIDAQLQNLEAKIAREVDRIAEGLSDQVNAAKARVAALRADYEFS